jgi:prolyl 4-hydroxylase
MSTHRSKKSQKLKKSISPINNIDQFKNLNEIGVKFPEGFKPRVIHKDPYIVKLRRFLNTEEINTILELSKHLFNPSTTVVNGEQIISDGRTSKTAFITENGQTNVNSSSKTWKIIERILKRVCYLTGCDRNQIEGLMVVKYDKGQEYYNHHDYFKPEDIELMKDGGQRIATFFCYLNSLNDNEGGETEFPEIGVKVKPSKGTAVFWWDVDKKGKVLDKTLHRGNPVNDGVKYGLNIWIRDKGW